MALGAAVHICANFATCSCKPLTMLNPQFVAGEHGLFGGHKSEDIRTFFEFSLGNKTLLLTISLKGQNDKNRVVQSVHETMYMVYIHFLLEKFLIFVLQFL